MNPVATRLAALMLFALPLLAPSAATAQTANQAHPQVTLPAEFAAVLRAYEVAWGERDADGLARLFTADGFVLRPGHPAVQGRDAIRQAYANSGGPLVLRAHGYAVSDSVGYIVGGYGRAIGDPDMGKFVLALREVAGKWLIAADMDNDNGPPG